MPPAWRRGASAGDHKGLGLALPEGTQRHTGLRHQHFTGRQTGISHSLGVREREKQEGNETSLCVL